MREERREKVKLDGAQRFNQPNLLATDWLYARRRKRQPLVLLMRLHLVNAVPGNELGVEMNKAHCQALSVSIAAAAKSLQSCPTLCDPRDSSPPGSPVPGILQARVREWGAISFSNAWKWKGKVKSFSRVRLLATPWTAAYQAPLSMGFSRQEYWSGVPLPSPLLLCKLPQT